MEKERRDIRYHSMKGEKLENLIRYVNKYTLIEQHKKQEKGKATGIDKISKEEYDKRLEDNIDNLLSRMKKMSYKPLPVRRVNIPKANGKLRPLGIPSYEDKLVQGIMAEILDAIYDCKFLECSYGFRPGRNCHQAIREINQTIMIHKANYILDCDIKGFFDNVNHEKLMKMLEEDIKDKTFLRYVKRFLISGYMEEMKFYETDKGTPQGGLISPILANVYLHNVLDKWFQEEIKPRLRGEAYLVRYADDFIIMFQYEEEAKRVYEVLPKRFQKFDLELAEDKTHILPFGRFKGTKEEFDFLGFTHMNKRTRTGKYTVGHRMSKKKVKQKHQSISKWLKDNRHMNVQELIEKLNSKLRGTYAYYGINGMIRDLIKLCNYTKRTLYSVLKRRSQRTNLTYEVFQRLITKVFPLEKPRLYHEIWNVPKII